MINFKNKKIQEIKNRQIQKENQDKIKELQEKNQNYMNYKKLNKPFEFKETYNSVIPLNLYTCWHTKELPTLLKSTNEILIAENPEFNHYLYDENDCREFIQQHFDQDVVDAYNSLIPCSYKSDLWRFCILYINGGIYYDIKFRCLNGFKFIALTENEMFVRDMQENCVLTGLIVSKPGNTILKKCIDQIVINVQTRFYGKNPLYPTGPGLLGTFFTNEEQKNLISYFNSHQFDDLKLFYIFYNNSIILQFNNNNYRNEQSQYQKNPHYHDLWHNNSIYI
jgi:mannosyltransferase OCH1-like enzyme